MPAMPPTTPPTIAPTLVDDLDLGLSGDEEEVAVAVADRDVDGDDELDSVVVSEAEDDAETVEVMSVRDGVCEEPGSVDFDADVLVSRVAEVDCVDRVGRLVADVRVPLADAELSPSVKLVKVPAPILPGPA
jgi:hypothetical protein